MIGVGSYGILIVSDAMRLVASQLRLEDVPSWMWTTFLVAVYVPASVLLGWLLAWALGLLPRTRPDRSAAPGAVPRAVPASARDGEPAILPAAPS
jgi:hypothetical protein